MNCFSSPTRLAGVDRSQETTMKLSKSALGILSVLALAASACGSSNEVNAMQGPECTSLQICCDDFPPAPDGGGESSEQDSCNITADAWTSASTTTAAAAVEANCASAEAQYKKERLCGGASSKHAGSD
jgi:hypothetical protein